MLDLGRLIKYNQRLGGGFFPPQESLVSPITGISPTMNQRFVLCENVSRGLLAHLTQRFYPKVNLKTHCRNESTHSSLAR